MTPWKVLVGMSLFGTGGEHWIHWHTSCKLGDTNIFNPKPTSFLVEQELIGMGCTRWMDLDGKKMQHEAIFSHLQPPATCQQPHVRFSDSAHRPVETIGLPAPKFNRLACPCTWDADAGNIASVARSQTVEGTLVPAGRGL